MLNRTVIMGRMAHDLELRRTSQNKSFLKFSVAVERRYFNSKGKRLVDFIPCEAWGHNADFISKYFKKGQMIAIDGSIKTGQYTDENGNLKNVFEVTVDNVSFCGSKQGDFKEDECVVDDAYFELSDEDKVELPF